MTINRDPEIVRTTPVFDEVESADAGPEFTVGAVAGGDDDGLAVLPAPPNRRRSSSRGLIALACVGIALAAVIWRGLGSASLYFYTADEAVARADSLGERRFRLEGLVATEAEALPDGQITFDIEEGGATVRVRHDGEPQELFQVGIPVVLEGSFAARGNQPANGSSEPLLFESDRMIIKHTNEYTEEYPDRVQRRAGSIPVTAKPLPTAASAAAPR